jgi:hypothetical protein
MYKYIIYCSVSAAIILSAKYIYQYWIKQNHTIDSLKQEIKFLQDKVKKVEDEFKKNKGSITGGVQIPIVFNSFKQNEQKTIKLNDNLSSVSTKSSHSVKSIHLNDLSSNHSNHSIHSNHSNHSIHSNHSKQDKEKSEDSSQTHSSKKIKKVLNIENISDLKGNEDEHEQEIILLEENVKTVSTKKIVKKKTLPDPKDYNNGDKHKDENGVEYLCIVGKRGGHSWQKITV